MKIAQVAPLYERARKTAQSFDSFRIDHVYREQNRDADRLVNEVLDEAEGKPAEKKTASAKQAVPAPPAKNAAAPAGPRLIPARYRSGVLYLLEDMGLPDGTVCKIILHSVYDPSKK